MLPRPLPAGRRLAAMATLAVLLATGAGCGGSPPSSPGAGSTPSATTGLGAAPATTAPPTASPSAGAGSPTLPAGWVLCVNSVRGTSMGYPGGWYTTQLRDSEKCSRFDPARFTIHEAAEYPITALSAVQTETSVAQYVAEATRTDLVTVLGRTTTTVAGLPAERFETKDKGEGLFAAGTRIYGYAVDHGGRAFVVWTVGTPGESRYAAWKAVVDQAVATLHFT